MKILILGNSLYAKWLHPVFESLPEELESVEKADLIVFTGGADVDPAVYGHERHNSTRSDKDRDLKEHTFYIKALALKKPMLGICRGSQFLTACQPGGYLVQDVDGHAIGTMHSIEFQGGNEFLITSTHHQMMYPYAIKNYELLAWSTPRKSDFYRFGSEVRDMLPLNSEPEVVFYPDSRCFCIQGHPEAMSLQSGVCIKLRELINKKLYT